MHNCSISFEFSEFSLITIARSNHFLFFSKIELHRIMYLIKEKIITCISHEKEHSDDRIIHIDHQFYVIPIFLLFKEPF